MIINCRCVLSCILKYFVFTNTPKCLLPTRL
nr:MAG TPA: hypothetical protein [Microviridae sp.]